MSPSYVFKVDEIRESPHVAPHADAYHAWIPSPVTVQNAHIPRAGGASGTYFVCDGQRIYALPDSSLPAGCVEFKEYSVYYNQGFWILHGNATRPPLHEAWKKLYFDHEQDYSSYLTPAGQHSALACQRADQRWPRMLLPDIYHGPLTPYQQYGGLVGELPIFLALMAFSIGRDHVNWMFQNCFTDGRWLIHQYPSGREYQRGVVVKVWTTANSTEDDLEAFESGALGKYFN